MDIKKTVCQVSFFLAVVFFILNISIACDPVTPPENSIPIVGQRVSANFWPTYKGIRIDQLCSFMWRHMGGTHGWEWAQDNYFQNYYGYCEDLGMLVVLSSSNLGQYQFPESGPQSNWFRNTDYLFTDTTAYAKADTIYAGIVRYVSAASMWSDSIIGIAINNNELIGFMDDFEALWFYYLLDEGPARQRNHMLSDDYDYDDYFPNMYTQAWDDSVPALDQIVSTGIYSWLKYAAENDQTFSVPTAINFSLLNTILMGEYTGMTESSYGGTSHRQAVCVDALCNAQYVGPPSGGTTPSPVDNSPEFILFDYYPFRYVNSDSSSTATMCDDDWVFLIEHLEEGMDSTIVTALENGVITYYLPQAFGAVTGRRIQDESGIHYPSLMWRKPAPQEFLLNCNLALLHQAKGIFPYSLRSYYEDETQLEKEWNFLSSAFLDINLTPFNAPYEEYVYANRCPVDDTF